MSINNKNKQGKDFFDDDFEIIYEDDLSELLFDDAGSDSQNAPGNLSEPDEYEEDDDRVNNYKDSESGRKRHKKKSRGLPNLISPAAV